MLNRLRPKLTYANVISTLCLFMLLGGVAYAATALPKNSVGPKQLKKNAVTGGKIAANAVTGANVADGSLTGTDINAATLSKVPSATIATSAASANTADKANSATNADRASNSSALQGHPASDFLPSGATAANASRLGGQAADSFGTVMLGGGPSASMATGTSMFVPLSGYGSSTTAPGMDVTLTLPNEPLVARDVEVRLEGPPSNLQGFVYLLVNGVFEQVCEFSAIPVTCEPDVTFNLPAGSQSVWEVDATNEGPATVQPQLSLRLTPG